MHDSLPTSLPAVEEGIKAAMERAKLGHRLGEGGITLHSLRHCFGTAMAAQGVPMRTLQELMGHRDFSTTLIYADYAPSAHEAEWAEKRSRHPNAAQTGDLKQEQRIWVRRTPFTDCAS